MAANIILMGIIATLITLLGVENVGADEAARKPGALFVMGDSYVDTGNHNPLDPSLATPWRIPYGNNWPQKPSGRYSDGRVFTDFYASFLGVRKPVPYRVFNNTMHNTGKHKHGHSRHIRGVNFAFGGSGVFPTFGPQYPNISSQISQLQDLISRGLVSKKLIKASTVLLVIAGNDYTVYKQLHPNYEGITEFIPAVVEEMAALLEALHKVGFKRIATTNLAPVGCLPGITLINNYTTCNPIINQWSTLHNSLLASNMSSLQSKHPSTQFRTLDLHSAFQTAITDAELPLRPCCDGVGEASCGDVDKNGVPLYTLCPFSNGTLFWDDLHPTNAGWKAISRALF